LWDVIEVDPARRVKLRIEHERLAEMHPSELADTWKTWRLPSAKPCLTRWTKKWPPKPWRKLSPSCRGAAGKAGRREDCRHCGGDGPGAAADLLRAAEDQSDAILEEMEPEERRKWKSCSS